MIIKLATGVSSGQRTSQADSPGRWRDLATASMSDAMVY
jgi:hypothetical protein